jgi:hypothetical protein
MSQSDRHVSRTLAGISITVVVLVVLLVACVAVLPGWLVGSDLGAGAIEPLSHVDRIKAENDVRGTLLQGLGGILALGGVALGFAATLRQVRVNREGNNIGLFTKAIDQLSSENVSVRHGGIYALELLAGLDPAYRAYIHALLTAFIRARAPWPPGRPLDEVDAERSRFQGGLADDVGAAIAALTRRTMIREGDSSELEKADLRGAELAGRDFHDVCFAHSNLEGADLTNANLANSTLSNSILRKSNLSGADLSGASLDGADLSGVISNRATKWPAGFQP